MRWPLLLSVSLLTLSGCHLYPNDSNLVPAWIGLPAHLLAPNSQEAYAWRNRHRPLQGQDLMVGPNPVLQEVGPEAFGRFENETSDGAPAPSPVPADLPEPL